MNVFKNLNWIYCINERLEKAYYHKIILIYYRHRRVVHKVRCLIKDDRWGYNDSFWEVFQRAKKRWFFFLHGYSFKLFRITPKRLKNFKGEYLKFQSCRNVYDNKINRDIINLWDCDPYPHPQRWTEQNSQARQGPGRLAEACTIHARLGHYRPWHGGLAQVYVSSQTSSHQWNMQQ